jgi:UDP-N-acetylmuramoyl-L-alanyl-D-glutamate--2,6-diaminopimelate ligase
MRVDLCVSLAAQGAMIERLSSDSRRCAPGVAFLAYPGEKADGRAHIAMQSAAALRRCFGKSKGFPGTRHGACRTFRLRAEAAGGRAAHEFYGRPVRALWVCGVTGTNGKTSCSQWIAAALGRHGTRAGVIGTLGSGFPAR